MAAYQVIGSNIFAYLGIAFEYDAIFLHYFNAAVDNPFFQLKIGDTVTQQTTRTVVTFVNGYRMTRFAQLRSRCQPRRAGTHYRHLFT